MRKAFRGMTAISAAWIFLVVLNAGGYGGVVDQILDADYEALEQPLAPESGGFEPAKLSAKLGYVWRLPDQTQAMVLLGDFILKLPLQTLISKNAVIWLSPSQVEGEKVKRLDIYMEGDAQIIEAAGGMTCDNELFTTVYTNGQIEIQGDSIASSDGSNQDLYRRAEKVKSASPAQQRGVQRVVIHGRPKVKEGAELQERAPIAIRGNFVVGPRIDGQPVLIGTNGIYLMQGVKAGGEALEIRATNAVVFLKPEGIKEQVKGGKDKKGIEGKGQSLTTLPAGLAPEQIKARLGELPTEEESAQAPTSVERARSNRYVSAVYLEGDVILTRGYRQIRADQVYYDFEESKALIYNAVARTIAPSRNVPIYIRATEIRQLNETSYEARNAKLSTSEFYTPSYHVGATKVYFEDRTEKLPSGEQVGLAAGRYKIYNSTMNVEGVPLLYWPFTQGDFRQAETSIKSINVSYDSDYGPTVKSRWYLFPLIGIQEPEGVDATLKLDYYGERGPGVGIDAQYERDTYFGLMRSYYINDHGEDDLGGYRNNLEPPYDNRGRFLTRHRQYLPKGWELTLELSYLSDKNFLEEFFRDEFENGKEQETLIYLKKVFGDYVFSILGKWRINDFLTQTEKLPDVAFDVLGKQMGNSIVTWFSENHVGAVRRLNENDTPWWLVYDSNRAQTDTVFRGDTRQELDAPFAVGKVKLVPFGMVRGTAWDDSPEEGGLARGYGQLGVRGSTYQWRNYDNVVSRFWDVNRIRHIMKEDFTVWGSAANVHPNELTPFDEGIETINDVSGVTAGWRNRWQTKRGTPGNLRTVDLFTLDLETGYFNNPSKYDGQNETRGQTFSYRPENSVTSNYASMRSKWQASDSMALLYDAIVDTDDCRMGESGVGLSIEKSPRFNWFVGHRYIGMTRSNLLAFGANYRLNSKYTIGFEEEFDLDEGKNADFNIMLVRKLPRWNVALSAGIDDTQEVKSISLSFWPEGIPEWTLGSRKYNRMQKLMPLD